ncbi:ABC transporter permease subunit [Helicobacter muridarum]|uniref:ABC transporter permease subunit n=1 Tax=Helicobacter muridarum TaxID=216 RepID=A0A099TYC0_9HELI|nr:ABC transporter permease subunit [Helicobacter muridarum]TLE01675.1 ABC transporter permease subunit [Helicobacter muridarum]STQ86304.1 Molybdenum transport system permease protein ModB (TC 3.A.1.8.1) [Helicobacter muridarum]
MIVLNNPLLNFGLQFLQRINLHSFLFCICLIVLGIFLVIPLGFLFAMAFLDTNNNFIGLQNFKLYLDDSLLLVSLKNTFVVSLTSTFFGVSFALICAYAILRTNLRGKKVFHHISMLPLFVPNLTYGLGLAFLFGKKGIITSFLGLDDFSIYGFTGIVIAQSIYIFPQSFLIIHLGLQSADYRLYEQAKIIGISPLKSFLYITLPNIKFSLLSAVLVSFILCFTDFGTPIIIGGGYSVLSIEIYKQIIGVQNLSMGATISIILFIPSLIIFWILKKAEKQTHVLSAKATKYQIDSHTLRDVIFGILASIPTFVILTIMFSVLLASLITLYPHDLSLTLAHFQIESSIDGLYTLKNSLIISLLTAVSGAIFVFIFGYLNKMNKSPILQNIANFLIIAPAALPGLVVGIAYILFFNKPDFQLDKDLYLSNIFYSLYGTFWIIVICNIIHFFSIPSLSVKNALAKIDNELEAVCESMGISKWGMLKRIYIPLCLPAILENFIYFFLNSMISISAIVFIYSTTNKMAAITIIHLDEKGYIEEAAALAILIMCINFIMKFLYEIVKSFIIKKILKETK